MDNNKEIESILKLNKLVFDKIEFNRLGFKNDKNLELELQSNISERINKSKSDKESFYKVTLLLAY